MPPTGTTRYCRRISAAIAVGPTNAPAPCSPKAFISALSSNSPTMAGRIPAAWNQSSSCRRTTVPSPGSSIGAPVSDCGEPLAQPRRKRRRGEAGDGALAEQVAVGLHVDGGRHRRVGEHQVDLVQGEGGEQRFGPGLPADHADRDRQLQRRRQQAVGDLLAEHVGDADDEAHRAAGGAPLDGVEQLTAEREDLVGVAIDHLADIGRHHPAADSREQRLAEARFERLDLRAHRRLRQPQLLRRPDHAALAHDRPEVEQVVVVEPFHAAGPSRSNIGLLDAT